MKKLKGVIAVEAHPFATYEDPRTRFKHESLLQDYEELCKETEAMKTRLLMMKQKKLILAAEVRFLKQRYEFLLKNNASSHELRSSNAKKGKGKNKGRKVTALLPLVPPLGLENDRERVHGGNQAFRIKSDQPLGSNQKVRAFNRKKPTPQISLPIFDLNKKERIYSRTEADKRNVTTFFDLNQISKEEEELQADIQPSRIEGPKKSLLRSYNDQHNTDTKISICRSVGNGSSRAGKRKISWQDQVALKV